MVEDVDGVGGRARRVAARLGRTLGPVLGEGADRVALLLDDGTVLRVVRHLSAAASEEVRAEAALLEVVAARSPIPVPDVVAVAPGEGAVVVRRLPGTSLLDEPCPTPEALVPQLQAFLHAVHTTPLDEVAGLVEVDDDPPADHLDEAATLHADVADLLDEGERRLVERFLAEPAPAPAAELSFCHADLGAEHLLADADRATLTGVIDWSDAAITDPARDLGRLHRDLGPGVARAVATGLPGLDRRALERAAFHARCSLIEDLAYGHETGDERYLQAARAALARTFAPLGG